MLLYWISYLVGGLLLVRTGRKILVILRAEGGQTSTRPFALRPFLKGICEVLLLGRLFRSNPAIWTVEYLFHLSFALIMVEHLRFFLYPVPGFVAGLYPFRTFLGILMVVSILGIILLKVVMKRVDYISRDNLLLIGVLLVVGLSGLGMVHLLKVDIIGVKEFTMGLVTFRPATAPTEGIFLLHYLGFLIFLLRIPTHLFTAPVVLTLRRMDDENS